METSAETPFDPSSYGRFAAADYDDLYADLESEMAVEVLAELAESGPVLEFGIGTGRLALPLLARGLEVHGVEGSPAMAELLAKKPGGERIPVAVGDFAETSLEGTFSLVVLAINTIYALPSQDAQVACFRNAARHLETGGKFVVDAWVPDPGAFRNGTAVRPVQITDGRIELEVARIDTASQTMHTNKVHLSDSGVRIIPANHRYAWPAELDLMGRLAGMRLIHRWQGWDKAPFVNGSTAHVSVWQKLSADPW
jgi:SAM-dependent methyltransferase